jgi:zinc protease
MTSISYADEVREYRLDNGLLVLLKENHNAPVINLNVVYRVGSKYERPGITGISHLLEHLMFKTTANHPLGDFDRHLKAVGADNNAYTWLDQTVYYETIAAHEIDIALELEADRMRNLSCLPEDHEFEMQVVRNELEQREDSPTGRLYEEMLANAFKAHPYGIPTIGWVDDVEGIETWQIREYYDTWYHPDNAFIVAVGDFDSDALFAKIQQYFGGIPSAGVVKPRLPQEPKQIGERRFKLRLAGQLDYVMSGWHVPQSEHPDAYALVVLGNILGSGRTSRLYKALVDSGLSAGAQAESSAFGYQDPFLFMAYGVVNPGVAPADVEEAIYAEIEKIKTDGATEEELNRAKKQARVSFVFDKDSIESEARALVDFELMSSWRDVDGFLPGIEAVTSADIMRVASEYLTEDNRTVGIYEAIRPDAALAGGPAGSGSADAPSFAPRELAPHFRGVPGVGNTAALQTAGSEPYATVKKLANGITLVLRENHNNATVNISGIVPAGAINDPADRQGVANLTVNMLSSGTVQHSKAELAQIMENSGISLGFGPSRENFSFSGKSLTEDFGLLLDMLSEQLLSPSFPENELELTRQQVLTGLLDSENDTFDVAFARGRELLYGSGHPFSGRVEGSRESVSAATVADLRAWYDANVTPSGTIITVVGDITLADAERMITERFGAWQASATERDALLARSTEFGNLSGQREDIELVDKSNVTLLWLGSGCNKTGDDWPANLVANFIMGGDFSSRLNNRLRVKEGLTYGAFSFFSNGAAYGPWAAMVQVNPANIEAAISATNEELARFATEGVSAEELVLAKSYLTGNFPVRLSTNGAVAGAVSDAVYLGRGVNYIEDYVAIINAVTLEQVNAAAARYMDPARLGLVVCGSLDAADAEEQDGV